MSKNHLVKLAGAFALSLLGLALWLAPHDGGARAATSRATTTIACTPSSIVVSRERITVYCGGKQYAISTRDPSAAAIAAVVSSAAAHPRSTPPERLSITYDPANPGGGAIGSCAAPACRVIQIVNYHAY